MANFSPNLLNLQPVCSLAYPGEKVVSLLESLRKHWKKVLGFLGVSAFLDLVREYFRAQLMNWIAGRLGPFGNWLSGNPSALFTLAVVLVLMWFVVLLVQERIWPKVGGLILDHNERPVLVRPSSKFIAYSASFLVVVTVVIGYGWWSYFRATRKPFVVSPPSNLRGAATDVLPVRIKEGRIIPFDTRELPCSYGHKSGHGLRGLRDQPGGPKLEKPSLVLLGRTFTIMDWQSEGHVDLLFYAEITNRGEASIAKDWSLCLVQDNKPNYYTPQSIDSGYLNILPPGRSLAENTSRIPIEHGHMAEGWLLFRLPANSINLTSFSGSIGCRDYLEEQVFMAFSTE